MNPLVISQMLVGLSVALVSLLILVALDYLTGEERRRPCVVVGREFTPACTSVGTATVYDVNGDLTVAPIYGFVPERYTLIVRVDGDLTSYETDAAFWASVADGETIHLDFRYGGMTGRRY